tara:strand:+ start:5816 stop:6736 length:921 start_codon:yes stop_codon:yes gene_type:complete
MTMANKRAEHRAKREKGFLKKISKWGVALALLVQPQKKRQLKRALKEKFYADNSNVFARDSLLIDNIPFEQCAALARPPTRNTAANKRLAVYSVYFGSSANKTLGEVPVPTGVDHYFISNNQEVLRRAAALGWIPRLLDLEVSGNVILSAHQSKIPKALPHRFAFLKDYRYLLYLDDKIRLDSHAFTGLISVLESSGAPLALKRHPSLDSNILEEFGEAMLQVRYRAQSKQIITYVTEELGSGYRLDSGRLFVTGIILRDMTHPEVNNINELWYSHILRCGIECQIAFDFVAQRYPNIAELPSDIG